MIGPTDPALVSQIEKHEGLRLKPYQDSVGVWTIGFGHNLNVPISVAAARQILADDLVIAHQLAQDIVPSFASLSPNRQRVVVDMAFNLGNRLKRFKRMLAAIEAEDFDAAAYEMTNSVWARQVKGRARALSKMMRDG